MYLIGVSVCGKARRRKTYHLGDSGQKYTWIMTKNGGMLVLANIQRHCENSPIKSRFSNATDTMNPNMMPKA
jgi:hypothetical protein